MSKKCKGGHKADSLLTALGFTPKACFECQKQKHPQVDKGKKK